MNEFHRRHNSILFTQYILKQLFAHNIFQLYFETVIIINRKSVDVKKQCFQKVKMFVTFGHWILESLCVTSNAYTLKMHCCFEPSKRIWLSTFFYVMYFSKWWPLIGTVNSLFPDRPFVTHQHLNFWFYPYFDRPCRARTMEIEECIRSFQNSKGYREERYLISSFASEFFFSFSLYLISFYFSDRDLHLYRLWQTIALFYLNDITYTGIRFDECWSYAIYSLNVEHWNTSIRYIQAASQPAIKS